MPLNYQQQFITEQEYLAGELVSAVRHEYINGAVYAMAGAISGNRNQHLNYPGSDRISHALGNALSRSRFQTWIKTCSVVFGYISPLRH